jgi:hypothetical protein
MAFNRSRWAAVGAAVAVTLGAGGLGLVKAAESNDPSVFVPITNCRLFDTRSTEDVGPWDEPIGPDEEITVDGHGDVGQCVGLPDTATALQLNVTAVNATETTHLTIFPADAETLPNASSLNPQLGHGTAWNAVTVRLSPDGQFKVYNLQGTIDVLADVTGYFVPAEAAPTGPEPAVATSTGEDADVTDTADVAHTLTMTAPATGKVVAQALATVEGTGGNTVTCSLSDSDSPDTDSERSVGLSGSGPVNLAVTRTFDVASAGDLTVNLVCTTDTGTATAAGPQLTLSYVPGPAPTTTTTTTIVAP